MSRPLARQVVRGATALRGPRQAAASTYTKHEYIRKVYPSSPTTAAGDAALRNPLKYVEDSTTTAKPASASSQEQDKSKNTSSARSRSHFKTSKDNARSNRPRKSPTSTEKSSGLSGHSEPCAMVTVPSNADQPAVDWPAAILRDLCTCPSCVDPSSKQRNYLTSDIPADIEGTVIEHDDKSIMIEWKNDVPAPDDQKHVTILTRATLEHGIKDEVIWKRKMWSAADFEASSHDFTYDDYMNNDTVLYQVLKQLRQYGLVFLQGVPETEESVSKIAERIGPVKNTLYGYTWDVKSVPNALNVAYTAKDLGFHMDLLPMVQPPELQFLHCLRSSAKGGNSLFMDSYRAATDLFDRYPSAYKDLKLLRINYHYDHPETHLYSKKWNVISNAGVSSDGRASFEHQGDVRWSPPFQAPFSHKGSISGQSELKNSGVLFAKWRAASAKFNEMIQQPDGIVERLLKPGECVLFHNTRVLHARTAFEVDDAGKERWLRGAYVDLDPWRSKMRVLIRRYGLDAEPEKGLDATVEQTSQ